MPGESHGSIALEQLGLGGVLRQFQLSVPSNQREYSWEREHVEQLFDDLADAMREGDDYFLGSIVTIPRQGRLEVVDGQQRLATTAILLSAMRDYLRTIDEEVLVESIENEFLTGIDRSERQRVPKLRLNVDDNGLFGQIVTGELPSEPVPRLGSHERMLEARAAATARIRRIVSSQSDVGQHGDILNAWVEFLDHQAVVILLKVVDDSNAYKMFETLNDRGLRTSQVDLIKNYVFSNAGNRIEEIQSRWSYMRGTLESFDEDDVLINFLRHGIIAQRGHVTAAKVYDEVRKIARNKTSAFSFVSTMEELATDYVAILSPDNEKWSSYPHEVRRSLEALNLFNIRPLRPLALAVAHRFPPTEVRATFDFLVSLGVRLMVASSTRSGSVEQPLAEAARRVWGQEAMCTQDVRDGVKQITPDDADFKAAFGTLRVSNSRLARYYLRRLQETDSPPAPEFSLQTNAEQVDLEHVLPKRPDNTWNVEDDDIRRLVNRLGNQALLRKEHNSAMKSASFDNKKDVYATSPYSLTAQISSYEEWDEEAIKDRQAALGDIAPRAWPV